MGTKPGKQNTRQPQPASPAPDVMTARLVVVALVVTTTLLVCGYIYMVPRLDNTKYLAPSSAVRATWAGSLWPDFHKRPSNGTRDSDSTLPTKTILFWNSFFTTLDFGAEGLGREPFANCSVSACTLVTNRRLLTSADAVVFHIRQKSPMPPFRPPRQLYVFFLRESPNHMENYYAAIKSKFNLTMTYRRDSDLPIPVSLVVPVDGATSPPPSLRFPLATRARSVAWVVSHCKTFSQRERYVRELSKHIDVDIYGGCGSKHDLCKSNDKSCFTTTIPSKYKYYLGFENSVCRDYITEKCFRTLDTEIIPVVYGGTNYTRDTPPHSVINVMDFTSPRKLAEYLTWLGGNETEYLKYFEWKNKYKIILNTRPEQFCHLCQKLHDANLSKTYEDVYRWWSDSMCHDEVFNSIMGKRMPQRKKWSKPKIKP